MQELFVGYEQALKLRSLGFDEECLAWYFNDKINNSTKLCGIYALSESKRNSSFEHLYETKDFCAAPLWGQAFDWFRDEKDLLNHLTTHLNAWGEDGALETSYGYRIMIDKDGWKCDVWEQLSRYETYEEARQALLNKLIEIVENETKSKIN